MNRQEKNKATKNSRWHLLSALGLGALVVFVVVQQVSAGPITGGYGNAPFSKLSVYQGVLSIVPGGAGDSVMEIGNAGRDIKSTGSINLFPGTAGGGVVAIQPQSAPSEGAELVFSGGSAPYNSWHIDTYETQFRIHTANNGVRLAIDGGLGGNVYITSGQLCFGNVGDLTKCSSTWGATATPTLDQVLATTNGNFSTRSASLGSATAVAPSAKLVVNNGVAGGVPGSNLDAVATYANTTGSAIYAQQSNTEGWAGYFSGRINITGSLTMGGVDKAVLGIQVCPTENNSLGVNSGCLGQYLYSGPDPVTPPTATIAGNGLRYYYWKESTATIESVLAFSQFTNPTTTCAAGYTKTTRCTSGGEGCISYFTFAGCSANDGEYMLNSVTKPYGTGEVCVRDTSNVILVDSYRSPATGGACTTVAPNPKGTYITGRQTRPVITGTYYLPTYELR